MRSTRHQFNSQFSEKFRWDETRKKIYICKIRNTKKIHMFFNVQSSHFAPSVFSVTYIVNDPSEFNSQTVGFFFLRSTVYFLCVTSWFIVMYHFVMSNICFKQFFCSSFMYARFIYIWWWYGRLISVAIIVRFFWSDFFIIWMNTNHFNY